MKNENKTSHHEEPSLPESSTSPASEMELIERLREIRGRLEKATPGEWTTKRPEADPRASGFPAGVIVCAVARGQGVYANPPGGSFPAADQDFIAHAPSDIRFLLDALSAARKEALEEDDLLDIIMEAMSGFKPFMGALLDMERAELAQMIVQALRSRATTDTANGDE